MKRGPLILAVVVLLYSLTNLAMGFPMPNFSPMAAFVFCAAAWFGGYARWAVPLGAWFVLSALGSYLQGFPFVAGSWLTGVSYLLIFLVGHNCARFTRKPGKLFWLSLSAPLIFYAVTNFASFIIDPRYLKSITGFTQAMWTGIPTEPYPPTWVFLRGTLTANALFSAAFFGLALFQPAPRPKPITVKPGLTQT